MGFTDKIKAKAAELGLDTKAQLAKEKAAAAADGNRGKIADAVQKAGATVNEKTGGKYADKVAKAQGAAMSGVDKVAASGTGAASTTTGNFGDQAVGTDAAIDRTVGQDGLRTANDQFGGESPVDRAIGADAPTSSLDPNTSFSVEQDDASTTGIGTHDVRDAEIDNAAITDPEINSVSGEDRGATDSFGNKGFDAQGPGNQGFGSDTNDTFGTSNDLRDVDVDNAAVTDPEINSVRGGDAGNETPMRRVGDGLPEDGPHGDTLR